MKYLLLTVAIILSLTINSQEKWTLEQCMRYAIENSPKKNKKDAENSIYHQNYLEAVGKLLPSLKAEADASFQFGRGLDSETNAYIDRNSFSNGYSLNSSMTLFDGLSGITRVKLQKMNKLMGKQKLQETIDILAYETMEEFINVSYYMEMVTLAEQQLEESTSNVKRIKRMEELGMKGAADVAELVAKEASDNYNLTRQKNILVIGIIKLKEKMNFPIDEDLMIAGMSMDELITKSEDSALSLFEKAKYYNPKVMAAESSLQTQKLSYKVAKGGLFPVISVGAGISTNFSRYMDGSEYSSFKNQIKDRRGHYVGFNLSIPIFSGFSRSAQVKKSKAELVIAENERDETLRAVYSEIEQAIADMNGQADEYYQAKKQTDAMTIAHNVNQRKYTEGLISAIDLHTSANRLLQARVDEVNARLKYELKHRLVNYYRGIPFIVQ
ncbi:outer membrane protein [Dysgonomonas sp. PFB1-18]|uniref:TolC family protein n=1 Tax=unclassified Dysgonomonas TaxID=2630389 RepID=UPI00247550CC|nr:MULTISPECIES: TolC family protein [unclassified Dysgonomonas]MDH6309520.1 outer membrane protein [Dysgonomonas sp. PF1-14]MDH6339152.1 outer membrane protein [Dysgonomonas sp. PF1-16]MDH6380562.1 outer membrane protein [Dysgonomonas sp. PFB1-18]MDH6398058.1 outer membrane protein [Dysgonomonas sp. PF1-23]